MAKINLAALLKKAAENTKKAAEVAKKKKASPRKPSPRKPSPRKPDKPKIRIPSRSERSRRSRPRTSGWHPFVTPPEGTVLFVDVVRRAFGTAYVPMELLAISLRSFLSDHGQGTAGVAVTAVPGELTITVGGPTAQRAANRRAIAKLLPKLGLSAEAAADDPAPYLVWATAVEGGLPMLVPEALEDAMFVALVRAGRFAGVGLSSEARRRLKG